MILCNRKERGDRLLQSGRSDLAALTYLQALQKVSNLREYWLVKIGRPSCLRYRNRLSFPITSGPFKDLEADHATKAFRFKVQASMVAAYSRSGRHRDVINVAEAALDSNQYFYGYETSSERRDWVDAHKSDYAKLHYHKALALEKLGDMTGAVGDMEKALKFDQENDMALAELSRLQRKLEEKVAQDNHIAVKIQIRRAQMQSKRELKSTELRQEKARKLYIMQDRLRKKQNRRREKA